MRRMAAGFGSAADVAVTDVALHISAHGGPEEASAQQLERFLSPWVAGGWSVVGTADHTQSQIIIFGDIESILIE